MSAAAPADDRPNVEVRHRGLLMAAIMAATVMQILDTTIANVALPHMQASLGATQESINWVLTSYIVASAVAMPISGWLSNHLGVRRLLLLSVAGFTLSSILCGMALNLPAMVAFRLLQGVAGAFIAPLAQTVLLDINAPSRHAKAMAIYGSGIMIGPIVGPVLGGWLTENFDWRWVFYVNLPVGLLCLAGLWVLLPKQQPSTRRGFDALGWAFIALGICGLQLMLDRGAHVDWFASTEIWVEAAIALSGFWMFGVHMFTSSRPLFPRAMLSDRNMITSAAFMFVMGVVMMAAMALLPPLLQGLLGYPVLEAGELLAARGIGIVVTMGITGRLMGAVDPRLLVASGFSIMAFSLWLMTGWTLQMGAAPIVISGVVQGMGLGLVFLPLNLISFATLPPEYRTDGASLLNLARNIGASIGIAIIAALLSRNIQVSHSDLAAEITPYNLPVDPDTLSRLSGLGTSAMQLLDAAVNREAAMIAYLDDFWVMMIATILTVPLAAFLQKPAPRKGEPPPMMLD